MIVAGHADGYHNMAFRTFEALHAPPVAVRAVEPHEPPVRAPRPEIDHVGEMLGGSTLGEGEENGIDLEPPIQMFVRPPPARARPRVLPRRVALRARVAARAPARGRSRAHHATTPARGGCVVGRAGDPRRRGRHRSIWCADDLPFGPPWDQRADEAFSLVYDWPALDAELEIMGHPRVEVLVALERAGGVRVGQALRRLPGRHSALVTRAS